MQSSEVSDREQQVISREIRMLCAFLRDEEQRRGCLLREVSAVRLWQYAPGHSRLTRWIGTVALERRQGELAAVDRSIDTLKAKIRELVLRLPRPDEEDCAALKTADSNHGLVGPKSVAAPRNHHRPDAAHG